MNGQIRLGSAILMVISVLAMKICSVKKGGSAPLKFWLSPLPCTQTWYRCPEVNRVGVIRLALFSVLAVAPIWITYFVYDGLVDHWALQGFSLSYLSILVAIQAGFVLIPLRLLSAFTGKLIPSPHRGILLASSIAEFWGKRYNFWISDWFRQIIFKPLQKRPEVASIAVFLFSGVWHELVLNVPFLVVFHRSLLGTMTAYFLIQWLGTVIDRFFLRPYPIARRVFVFVVVVGPAPLFMNEAVLRLFGLWR